MELANRMTTMMRAAINGPLKATPFSSCKLVNFNQKRTTFYERYRHGPNRKHNPPPMSTTDVVEALKEAASLKGFQRFRKEFKIWAKQAFLPEKQPLVIRPFELYTYEHFDTDETFDGLWNARADSDTTDGFSKAYFERSPLGHGLFHGVLDTRVPDDGMVQESGFVALIGPKRLHGRIHKPGSWNFKPFTHIVLRVRGDGRTYRVLFNTASENDDVTWYDNFSYPLFTHGGPYWQDVKLPFSRFVFNSKSYTQDYQPGMPRERIKFVAISLQDNYDGPFRLEIDHISLMSDERHKENCAYEHYAYKHMPRPQKSYGSPLPELTK